MTESRTALILTGGGARAGYQVGVLKAIRELLHEPQRNPFPILCGTSAGDGLTVGPILLGAARPVHILTPTATVRRIVNMTALLSVEAQQQARSGT